MSRIIILFFLFFIHCTIGIAQEWTKEDAIWLQNVLEGKDTLKLNDETKKAIDTGRFITPSALQESKKGFDLKPSKDFNFIETPDSLKIRRFDPYSLPPGVSALYVLYLDILDSAIQVKSIVFTESERKQFERLSPAGLRIWYPHTTNYFPGFTITTDYNHLLSMMFSPKYRQMVRFNKNLTAYKNYNFKEEPIKVRYSELQKKRINDSVNNIRSSIEFSSHFRMGRIYD